MDEEEILGYHLLVNPSHYINKHDNNDINGDINEDIFLLLNKRFPDCTLEKLYHLEILSKIEIICIEYTIKNILDSLINNIIYPYKSDSDE